MMNLKKFLIVQEIQNCLKLTVKPLLPSYQVPPDPTFETKMKLKQIELSEKNSSAQVWDVKDYRNVRFTNAKRYVNKFHSISDKQYVITKVNTRTGCCNGGGAMGHPIFYMNLDSGEPKQCYYCGAYFQKMEEIKL